MFGPQSPIDINCNSNLTTKWSVTFHRDGIRTLLLNLKAGKAPGQDGFTKADLTLENENMSDILTAVFQYSIDIGGLPASLWNLENVVHIFKAGKRTNPSNYRPVSCTCISWKLLKHIVLRELISGNQHGFRKGLSYTTQLVGLLHKISREVDEGKCIQAAFLDLSKAFDGVLHGFLLQKLENNFDIPTELLKWIKSFWFGENKGFCSMVCRKRNQQHLECLRDQS